MKMQRGKNGNSCVDPLKYTLAKGRNKITKEIEVRPRGIAHALCPKPHLEMSELMMDYHFHNKLCPFFFLYSCLTLLAF